MIKLKGRLGSLTLAWETFLGKKYMYSNMIPSAKRVRPSLREKENGKKKQYNKFLFKNTFDDKFQYTENTF